MSQMEDNAIKRGGGRLTKTLNKSLKRIGTIWFY